MGLFNTEDIKAYIDKPKSEDYYIKAFEKYNLTGVDQFKWNWSWWSFFGGVFFLLYRKLYIEALIFFIILTIVGQLPTSIDQIPVIGEIDIVYFLTWIASGGIFPYFVYRRFRKIKNETDNYIEDKRIDKIRELGGVNNWALVIGFIFSALSISFGIYVLFISMNV